MTKEEFLTEAIWRTEGLLQREVYSDFLGHNIEIQICFNQFDNDKELSAFSINSINDFLNLNKSHIDWIKEELWKSCDVCFQISSYGINGVPIKEGQTEYEANKEFFGIHNMNDSFEKAKAKFVVISNDGDLPPATCFLIEYKTPWDDEHGNVFVFVNGQKHAVE